jgi:hypothetical protein
MSSVAGELLRAHVRQRAHDLARAGLQRQRLRIRVGGAGDAEVEHLRLTVAGDQHIAGLEVAVDHAGQVRIVHGPAHVDHQAKAVRQRQRGTLGVLDQGQTFDQFHGQERPRSAAVIERARLMDLRDAGMRQPRQQLRLLLEAPQHPPARQSRAHHLQGDDAAGEVLLGPVDHAHPARAQHGEDGEPADPPRHGRGLFLRLVVGPEFEDGGATLGWVPRLEERIGLGMRRQQRFDARPHRAVVGAGLIQERGARRRLALQRLVEELPHAAPSHLSPHAHHPAAAFRPTPHTAMPEPRPSRGSPSAARGSAPSPSHPQSVRRRNAA